MGAIASMYGVTMGSVPMGGNALSACLNHPRPLLRMFTFFPVPRYVPRLIAGPAGSLVPVWKWQSEEPEYD